MERLYIRKISDCDSCPHHNFKGNGVGAFLHLCTLSKKDLISKAAINVEFIKIPDWCELPIADIKFENLS